MAKNTMGTYKKFTAKDAINKFRVNLIEQLPLDNILFFAKIQTAGLFPLGTSDIDAKATREGKVAYFLDHVVDPGADDYLPILLQVMKESGVANLRELANNIQKTIEPGL